MLRVMAGQRRAPDRDLLLDQHVFPGEYVVKAFGPGSEAFATAVEQCAVAVVGARHTTSARHSSGGRRMCVTLTLQAESVDEVIAIYERMSDVPGLLMIL